MKKMEACDRQAAAQAHRELVETLKKDREATQDRMMTAIKEMRAEHERQRREAEEEARRMAAHRKKMNPLKVIKEVVGVVTEVLPLFSKVGGVMKGADAIANGASGHNAPVHTMTKPPKSTLKK